MADDATKDAPTAAAFVFALYRNVRWDPERDDPNDVALYTRSIARARELWPWLDKAADGVEAAAAHPKASGPPGEGVER
jgi:hypothetical protein